MSRDIIEIADSLAHELTQRGIGDYDRYIVDAGDHLMVYLVNEEDVTRVPEQWLDYPVKAKYSGEFAVGDMENH